MVLPPGERRVSLLSNHMKTLYQKKYITLVIRLFIGITLIYAGLQKVMVPSDFAKIIYGYDLFPQILINLTAIILPYLEILSGLCILFGRFTKGAAIISIFMFSAFILAISINLIRGHEFDCGCFSVAGGSHSSPVELLIRDLIYLTCVIHLLLVKETS